MLVIGHAAVAGAVAGGAGGGGGCCVRLLSRFCTIVVGRVIVMFAVGAHGPGVGRGCERRKGSVPTQTLHLQAHGSEAGKVCASAMISQTRSTSRRRDGMGWEEEEAEEREEEEERGWTRAAIRQYIRRCIIIISPVVE